MLIFLLALACSTPEVTEPVEPAAEPAVTEAETPAEPAELVSANPPPAEPAVAQLPADHHPALLDPTLAMATAPDTYRVVFTTTQGPFVVQVDRAQAPIGADRFYNLVKIGMYDDVAFFRAIDGFMVQFGLSGYPQVNQAWRRARIQDDPVAASNERGTVTFATSGANSRTTQVFINFKHNEQLDGMGFAPFGRVVEGMDVVDSLYKGYGEGAPRGRGPNQGLIQRQGNAYLRADFPRLDYVTTARIEGE